jgi:nicotinate-nucleotide pyrophosphorylase (carboxylating)
MSETTITAASAVNITEQLFRSVSGDHRAIVEATEAGIVAGLGFVDPKLAPASAGRWRIVATEGERVEAGAVLVEIIGTAAEIGVAEDYVLGPIGFASGIATRAEIFKAACPQGMSIACGGWKKLPVALKPLLRAGLAAVGLLPRLVPGDFVYVNKNAVTLIGDVASAIHAGIAVDHGPVAVQVKNIEEALFAAHTGAGIIMVDTGKLEDLGAIHTMLVAEGLREKITLAFGGGVRLEDLMRAHQLGAQAVDVGRAILDAPLLDLRLRIIPSAAACSP